MNDGKADEHLTFYRDVLGLSPDPGARDIPDIPLFWMDCGNDTQIHMFEVDGVSKYARQPDRDPFATHVALGVPDIEAAKSELERLGIPTGGSAATSDSRSSSTIPAATGWSCIRSAPAGASEAAGLRLSDALISASLRTSSGLSGIPGATCDNGNGRWSSGSTT